MTWVRVPVCFNYGRETPVKLYSDPEIHACHRVSQHYSCQSEVVVVVVMTIITIITILLPLQTRFTATFNLFCRGDLARNHQAYNRRHLDFKYVTSHAKTFLTVCRFRIDSRSYAAHQPFERLRLSVQRKVVSVRTAQAIRAKKICVRLNTGSPNSRCEKRL